MKKFILPMVAACAVASSVMGQTVTLNSGAYSFGVGGEFNATLHSAPFTPVALTNSGSFETFCLERSENFQPGNTYHFTVDSVALLGGGGSIGGMDPLGETTAFLYGAFINGTLAGYDYGNGSGMRAANAGALQNAIWYLEQEVGSLDSAEAVAFYNFAQGGIGQGLGMVRVLNLFHYNDHGHRVHNQSQIFMLPTPGTIVLAGLAAGMIIRRRR